MARSWARLAFGVGAVAAGSLAGYLGERAVLRPRLAAPQQAGPALGSIAGEVTTVDGPDGVRVHVESYGPPGAPQVLFAHSWAMTGRLWHEQVAALSDRLRLVTYDHPGHGRSTAPKSGKYTMDLFADTLVAVLRDACAPGAVVLAGHSLGGMTILQAADRHRDLFAERVSSVLLMSTTSKVVLAEEATGLGIHALARFERLVRLVGAGLSRGSKIASRAYRASTDLSYLITRELGLAATAEPRHVDFVEQLVLDTDFRIIGELIPVLTSFDAEDAWRCITVPTVIVVGTADRMTPLAHARRMAQLCAHAELIELPGVGHCTPLEAASTVNALLLRLAQRADDRSAA